MTGQFVVLLEQGVALMGIGMGFVFAFLCILVFSMGGMSKAVQALNKIFPEEVKVVEKPANVQMFHRMRLLLLQLLLLKLADKFLLLRKDIYYGKKTYQSYGYLL